DLVRDHRHAFESESLVPSLYRPFTKQWLYFNRRFNERVYQMPRIFPDAEAENLAFNTTSTVGSFSVLIGDIPPSKFVGEDVAQWFPLYLYDEAAQQSDDGLF